MTETIHRKPSRCRPVPRLKFPYRGQDFGPILLARLIALRNHGGDQILAFANGFRAVRDEQALCREPDIFVTNHRFEPNNCPRSRHDTKWKLTTHEWILFNFDLCRSCCRRSPREFNDLYPMPCRLTYMAVVQEVGERTIVSAIGARTTRERELGNVTMKSRFTAPAS